MTVVVPEPPVCGTEICQKRPKHTPTSPRKQKAPKAEKCRGRARKQKRDPAIPEALWDSSSIRLGRLRGEERHIHPVMREPALQRRNPRPSGIRRDRRERGQWKA
eukprot:scaffold14282_cov103-Cylindrotheca_fusiformis.AAC.3